MTCMYQTTPVNNAIAADFRSFTTVDNSSGIPLPGNGTYYDCSSGCDDLGWARNGLDLTSFNGDGFLLGDDFHSAAPPLSPSSSHGAFHSPGATTTSSSSGGRAGAGGWEASVGLERRSKAGGSGGGGGGGGGGDQEKTCGVCGDKALGFNFDAVSCESCKAFFRRNAPKGLGYFKCPYDEKCKMDTSNRRFCKRCRLKKCFQIGMKKEYILTDEEKATKRRKIEENRSLKKMTTTTTTTTNNNDRLTKAIATTTAATTAPSFEQISSDFKNSTFKMASEWPAIETKWRSTQQPPPLSSLSFCSPSSSSSSSSSSSLSVINWSTIPLSAESASVIEGLRVAYRNSLVVNVDTLCSPNERVNLTDLVNIAELSVRRVIAMAKQVASFRTLPQVEQIHLLKGGSIELLIIRSVMTFDEEKQHFLDPSDHEETRAMRLDQLEEAESGLGLFDQHVRFVRSLASDLRADETTLILLLVISLFSPDRENITWKEFVSAEQERYSVLLRQHLESIHPLPVAGKLFPKLLMKLTDIRNLNEEHSQVLLKVRPEGIHPLMKEVLDLSA